VELLQKRTSPQRKERQKRENEHNKQKRLFVDKQKKKEVTWQRVWVISCPFKTNSCFFFFFLRAVVFMFWPSSLVARTTSGLNRFLCHFERSLPTPPPPLQLQQQLLQSTTAFRFFSTPTPSPPLSLPLPFPQTRIGPSPRGQQGEELIRRQKKKRTLWEFGEEILRSEEPEEKCSLTQLASQLWKSGDLTSLPTPHTPLRVPAEPGRPARPIVVPPQKLPRRQELQVSPSVYLLHNLAHIELNAVNLGWDTILRFSHFNLPKEFYSDWVHTTTLLSLLLLLFLPFPFYHHL
jgi:hypothetical protein